MTTDATTRDGTLTEEVRRRRTFAIISHPDAGKTTLTEKFLLYGGAVAEAGNVRARRNGRSATSDWMAVERQRGISITSAVLQFDAFGCRFNLLDTPGHQDFSEDTYRTLAAADSAVMVLDSARGIESQTLKLFQVCRDRNIPILTFINKMDHVGRDPLELLDEIERVLGMAAIPMNWPLGSGPTFRGVYDLQREEVLQFERTEGGRFRAPVSTTGIADPALASIVGDQGHLELQEQVDLLQAASPEFDQDAFLRGEVTPVFFGSALNNFGVEPFLESLKDLAPPPGPRATSAGAVEADDGAFSGFIFKIQANMDPHHRDRMAFMRICSGKFEKDMSVYNPRLRRNIRITRPHRLFAGERETVEEAYAGDVVGVINPGVFAIGDTVTEGKDFAFESMLRFEPEVFARLLCMNLSKLKQFRRGLEQLEEEGAVHVLFPVDGMGSAPVLAAVGTLQFEVAVARLEAEYGVTGTIEPLGVTHARRVVGQPPAGMRWPPRSVLTRDRDESLVVLFTSIYEEERVRKEYPDLRLEPFGANAGHSSLS